MSRIKANKINKQVKENARKEENPENYFNKTENMTISQMREYVEIAWTSLDLEDVKEDSIDEQDVNEESPIKLEWYDEEESFVEPLTSKRCEIDRADSIERTRARGDSAVLFDKTSPTSIAKTSPMFRRNEF